jgi:hypothetical protein
MNITAAMIASNIPAARRVAPDPAKLYIIDDIYAFAAKLRNGSTKEITTMSEVTITVHNQENYLALAATMEKTGQPFIHVNICTSDDRQLTQDEMSLITKMFLTNYTRFLPEYKHVMTTQLDTLQIIRNMK